MKFVNLFICTVFLFCIIIMIVTIFKLLILKFHIEINIQINIVSGIFNIHKIISQPIFDCKNNSTIFSTTSLNC